jgi:para-nitrobenzyl esterase
MVRPYFTLTNFVKSKIRKDQSTLSNTVVETQYGKVQGTKSGPIFVWKGIPFAQPPIMDLRFHAPQAPSPWTGVRDATIFGLTSVQSGRMMQRFFSATPEPSGEDCLFLNIWSPVADDKRRPVLFWIHGGAFTLGSASTPWYDGTAFATNGDAVVVTINYRLGALGFLHLADIGGEEKGFSNNCGLLDQIAALEWVRDNIAAFGGDPGNITVFGESAGAMSIGMLLAMPAAKGLFQRAILHSGASHTVQDQERATGIARKLMDILGIHKVTDLVDISLEQLLAAQSKVSESSGRVAFQPVVDGVTLPLQPIQAIAGGSAEGITLLVGTNRDEMRLFTMMDPAQATPDMDTLKRLFGANAIEAAATYEADQTEQSSSDAWIDFLTDRVFRIPAIRLAERQSDRGTKVWMYRFDWPTPVFDGRLKACHALEIPFVWNNLDKYGVNMLAGDSPARQKVADAMHAAWIAFARNGNPSTPGLPLWPFYDTTQRATMLFNEECRVVNDPYAAERRLWEGVL